MGEGSVIPTQTFQVGFDFAEKHMDAVRKVLGELPIKLFLDIETAPAKKDMEEATDLILSVSGGDIAVRIRRRKYWDRQNEKGWGHDWSVRVESRGHKTEIHKLTDGFGKWYFMAYSADDLKELAEWWLIDLDKIRSCNILQDPKYPIYDNGDGTAGKYININNLEKLNCIIASEILIAVTQSGGYVSQTRRPT